jgi:hypothetical protein
MEYKKYLSDQIKRFRGNLVAARRLNGVNQLLLEIMRAMWRMPLSLGASECQNFEGYGLPVSRDPANVLIFSGTAFDQRKHHYSRTIILGCAFQ